MTCSGCSRNDSYIVQDKSIKIMACTMADLRGSLGSEEPFLSIEKNNCFVLLQCSKLGRQKLLVEHKVIEKLTTVS